MKKCDSNCNVTESSESLAAVCKVADMVVVAWSFRILDGDENCTLFKNERSTAFNKCASAANFVAPYEKAKDL